MVTISKGDSGRLNTDTIKVTDISVSAKPTTLTLSTLLFLHVDLLTDRQPTIKIADQTVDNYIIRFKSRYLKSPNIDLLITQQLPLQRA
jgi:hypothetical protein